MIKTCGWEGLKSTDVVEKCQGRTLLMGSVEIETLGWERLYVEPNRPIHITSVFCLYDLCEKVLVPQLTRHPPSRCREHGKTVLPQAPKSAHDTFPGTFPPPTPQNM